MMENLPVSTTVIAVRRKGIRDGNPPTDCPSMIKPQCQGWLSYQDCPQWLEQRLMLLWPLQILGADCVAVVVWIDVQL